LQRAILQKLEECPAFYLLELFPWGLDQSVKHRSNPRVVALRRAAHNLKRRGKVRLYYSRGREHRLVVARPDVDLETLRRCLPRMTARRRIEIDLRKIDDEHAAARTERDNRMYLEYLRLESESYQQWLDEAWMEDSREAFEEWLEYGEDDDV
jgi:hypothetical protein